MSRDFNRNKTLQEIEKSDWGEPNYPSYLVTNCHRLRRKKLQEFTTEDLRIMIGQNIGLPYLIPLALEVLYENPLASGDFYKGDLLQSVLGVESKFWQENPELWREVESIAWEVERLSNFIQKDIYPKIEKFRQAILE